MKAVTLRLAALLAALGLCLSISVSPAGASGLVANGSTNDGALTYSGGALTGGGGGVALNCSDLATIAAYHYTPSTFGLCSWDQYHYQYSTDHTTLCPDGFDVWRFYSLSSDPGAIVTYTTSVAYQSINGAQACATANGNFSVPSAADISQGALESNAFTNYAGKQFTPFPHSGTLPAGNPVYTSTFASGDVTTNTTFAQYPAGSSCTTLQHPESRAPALAAFNAAAAGKADSYQLDFVNSYWANYKTATSFYGNSKARNYVMNLSAAAPNLSSPNWAVISSYYGRSVPQCTSNYQFAPTWDVTKPRSSVVTPIMGVCAIPFRIATEPWIDATETNILTANGKSTTTKVYQEFNTLLPSYGGPRYQVTGPSYVNNNVGHVPNSVFSTWRQTIANEVKNRPGSTTNPGYYVGSPYVNEVVFQNFGSRADRSLAAATAQAYSVCTSDSAVVPLVPTSSHTTTTTTTTPTTTTTIASGTPTQTVTPNASLLTAGGSLNPNTVSVKVSPFSCPGSCDPYGAGNDQWVSLKVVPRMRTTGSYPNFWENSNKYNKPVCSGSDCYLLLEPITYATTKQYIMDFAYPTKANQQVIFDIASATGTYREFYWRYIPCATTTSVSSPPAVCDPTRVRASRIVTYTPVVKPQVVTRVIGGAVTPSN